MQMTTEARVWLDATVRRILARHPLGDAERTGVTYELMSHLHAVGETRATAAGRGEVALEDLEAALAKAGGEDGLAAAFVQPLAKPLERARFLPRLGALAVDFLVIGIGLTFVHTVLDAVLTPIVGTIPGPLEMAEHRGSFPSDSTGGLFGLMPFGYHDPALAIVGQVIIAIASAVLVIGYFTWTEAREGRSLGKRAFDLRVMRLDGRPMTYRDAFVRNLVKLFPLVLLFDTIIMLVAFPTERQRVSDRIAGTIVVRA
jgi:hypothetical protein